MALNRCVKPVSPSAMRRFGLGIASPSNGRARRARRPRASSPAINSGRHALPAPASRSTAPAGRGRPPCHVDVVVVREAEHAPGRACPACSGDRNGPSKWMPSTPGHGGHGAVPPRRCAARILPGVSVIRVGSSPVVPKRRWAAAMAAMACGVGVVVEQHVAAAVHLHVDEARRQPCPVGQILAPAPCRHLARAAPRRRSFRPRSSPRGRGARRRRRTRIRPLWHAGWRGHLVRVTFCRWRGRSTSMPSCQASSSGQSRRSSGSGTPHRSPGWSGASTGSRLGRDAPALGRSSPRQSRSPRPWPQARRPARRMPGAVSSVSMNMKIG